MRAGDLRTRFTIEQAGTSSWSPLTSAWGRVRSIRGESTGGVAKNAPASDSEVLLRFRSDVTTDMRLRTGSRILWIDAVVPPDDQNTELLLYCTENAGTALDFTLETRTRDPATDTPTISTSTVSVTAIEVEGDPVQYDALGLVAHDSSTLKVRPAVPGSLPSVGSTATWGGKTMTVKAVTPIQPRGTIIAGRVVLSA